MAGDRIKKSSSEYHPKLVSVIVIAKVNLFFAIIAKAYSIKPT